MHLYINIDTTLSVFDFFRISAGYWMVAAILDLSESTVKSRDLVASQHHALSVKVAKVELQFRPVGGGVGGGGRPGGRAWGGAVKC